MMEMAFPATSFLFSQCVEMSSLLHFLYCATEIVLVVFVCLFVYPVSMFSVEKRKVGLLTQYQWIPNYRNILNRCNFFRMLTLPRFFN